MRKEAETYSANLRYCIRFRRTPLVLNGWVNIFSDPQRFYEQISGTQRRHIMANI